MPSNEDMRESAQEGREERRKARLRRLPLDEYRKRAATPAQPSEFCIHSVLTPGCESCELKRQKWGIAAPSPVLPVPPKSAVEKCAEIEAKTGLKRTDVEKELSDQYSFLGICADKEARGILWQALVDREFYLRARASSPAVAPTRIDILQEALDVCEQFDRTVEVKKCMDKIRKLQTAPAVAPTRPMYEYLEMAEGHLRDFFLASSADTKRDKADAALSVISQAIRELRAAPAVGWVTCSCAPEYSHNCPDCDGQGRVKVRTPAVAGRTHGVSKERISELSHQALQQIREEPSQSLEAVHYAIEAALRESARGAPSDKWMSVDAGLLPKIVREFGGSDNKMYGESERILVFNGKIQTGVRYKSGTWENDEGSTLKNVTYWREMLESPSNSGSRVESEPSKVNNSHDAGDGISLPEKFREASPEAPAAKEKI